LAQRELDAAVARGGAGGEDQQRRGHREGGSRGHGPGAPVLDGIRAAKDKGSRSHASLAVARRTTIVRSSLCGSEPAKAATAARIRSRSRAADSPGSGREAATRRSRPKGSPAAFIASVMPSV